MVKRFLYANAYYKTNSDLKVPYDCLTANGSNLNPCLNRKNESGTVSETDRTARLQKV